MTRFAAYDADAIYAVGDTEEEVCATVHKYVGPDAHFEVAPIRDGLAAWIEEYGWNPHIRSFALRDGEIVDTTEE